MKNKKIPEKALNAARLLFRLIKKNNPHNTSNGKHGRKWAESIQYLHEIDGQPYFLIEAVIKWCQADPFWYKNILSGQKLRKQWNNLTTRMNTQKAKAEELRRELEIKEQKHREKIKEQKNKIPKEVTDLKKKIACMTEEKTIKIVKGERCRITGQ
jgi:hypothetical protein